MKIPVMTAPSEAIRVPVRNRNSAVPVLNHSTRCDSCGARAYAAARFANAASALLFCAHHFTRWEAAIREIAVEVVDERFRLTQSVKAQKEDVASWLRK